LISPGAIGKIGGSVPPRRGRIPVVLDTNVVLGFYLSRSRHSANALVFRLWRDQRRIQLTVSEALVAEYVEILLRLGIDESLVTRLRQRLETRRTVTRVNLGRRFEASRDPDDNLLLATAVAGRAKFLITNDRDLLDIPEEDRRGLRFEIVTPQAFLRSLAEAASS
jgi:putative PIN family toxin of toxin-antitoxin system